MGVLHLNEGRRLGRQMVGFLVSRGRTEIGLISFLSDEQKGLSFFFGFYFNG